MISDVVEIFFFIIIIVRPFSSYRKYSLLFTLFYFLLLVIFPAVWFANASDRIHATKSNKSN